MGLLANRTFRFITNSGRTGEPKGPATGCGTYDGDTGPEVRADGCSAVYADEGEAVEEAGRVLSLEDAGRGVAVEGARGVVTKIGATASADGHQSDVP